MNSTTLLMLLDFEIVFYNPCYSTNATYKGVGGRDLQYILIQQYIDTLIEYCIVILCSMNIEIPASMSSACLMF